MSFHLPEPLTQEEVPVRAIPGGQRVVGGLAPPAGLLPAGRVGACGVSMASGKPQVPCSFALGVFKLQKPLGDMAYNAG